MPWSEELLQFDKCRRHDDASDKVVPCIKSSVGIAYGIADMKKPANQAMSTADYYGELANLAARLMGAAHPGQTLMHCSLIDLARDAAGNPLALPHGNVELCAPNEQQRSLWGPDAEPGPLRPLPASVPGVRLAHKDEWQQCAWPFIYLHALRAFFTSD